MGDRYTISIPGNEDHDPIWDISTVDSSFNFSTTFLSGEDIDIGVLPVGIEDKVMSHDPD